MVRFANPDVLYLLSLIPAGIVFYFFVFRWKSQALERFGNLDLVRKLTMGVSRKRQILKAGFLLNYVIAMFRICMSSSESSLYSAALKPFELRALDR